MVSRTKQVAPVKKYTSQIKQKYSAGGSTEFSYRGDLQTLLDELISGITVINEPKRQEFGAPDYVIKKDEVAIGYIEAKDIGTDLNKVEKTEQMQRYFNSLDNLILTDYLEFRFFKYGEKIKEIKIGTTSGGKLKSYPDTHSLLVDYFKEFCGFEGETIKSAEKLAKIMAKKARIMEEVLQKAVKTGYEDNTLWGQYKAFKDILIHDLDEDTFADIYAQTITYGMFAARLHDPNLGTFSRFEAATLIPKTNPFLRNLFQYIAGYDLDDRIAWIVEALADVFRVTDVSALIKTLGDVTQQNDPMIHFYETFLAEYDPKLRKKRGIWYTPEPVVNFIVRAVDDILKSDFNLHEGLADNTKITVKQEVFGKKEKVDTHKVQILDPAVGTGTFLAGVIKLIYQKYCAQQGIWNDYVEKHLIPRLNGFELLMAPYAMAHLKLELLLSETGYKPQKPQRLRVFLTNALEEHHPDTGTIFATWLSQEANEANYVKRDTPVMVVLGNPPYYVSSANKGEWIQQLIGDYKKGLNEKKINIDDDYIKFIRYGQHFIENNGEGILAYISNNSFLDGVTHRQMRKELLGTFGKIYILNLHGDTRNKEVSLDGTPDKNIFDIQQGVSINIFVKKKKKGRRKLADVYYHDMLGLKENKYNFLQKNTIDSVKWSQINYTEPYYFFTPKDFSLAENYGKGFQVTDLFLEYNTGIQTKRDKICISFNEKEAKEKIEYIKNNDTEKIREYFNLPPDGRDWKIKDAKKDILNSSISLKNVLYRPFDTRKIIYTGNSRGIVAYPRHKTSKHLLNYNNLSLITLRINGVNEQYVVLITNNLVEKGSLPKGNYSFFPLYFYEEESILSEIGEPERTPNLNFEIVNQIAANLRLQFTPEKEITKGTFAPIDILDYIYAVLHSPSYREKYKEFLKIDFPHIPYPQDTEIFWKLVNLGGELRQIHLLESPLVENYITTYPKDGTNEVEKIRYDNGKVWINNDQYFDNVPQVAWEFYIGGYQPAQKWLKDRKGRVLGFDDVRHYQKIVVALVETDRLMKEIDKLNGL